MKVKVFLLFTILSLLLFWPIFTGKVNLNGNLLVSFYAPFGENLPYKNSGWDQLRIYFPFYKITLEAIKNFEIPLWNPYAFSGHPHMADFQTAVFYPLNIFGLVLGQIEFWHLLRITPSILAAFFTFLYLRTLRPFGYAQGQLSKFASLFGSLTFGFSPFILTWGEEVVMSPHSIVWLPLILWGIEKYLERLPRSARNGHKKYLAIIALATAASFFGGYMQTSIYMFVFIGAYLVFRFFHLEGVKAHLRGVLAIASAFVLGAGIAAVQLLPSAELYFNAARSQVTLREQLFNFLLPIESIFTYLAPDFFGNPATHNFFRFGDAQYYEGILFVGVAALVFAIYMILGEREKWLVRFLAISSLVALMTAIDWFGARIFLSLPIPFLSTSIPNRVLFIPAFCLAVLAAGGFDRWQKEYQIGSVFLRKANSKYQIFKSILIIAGVYAGILVTLLWVRVLGFPYFEHKQFLTEGNLLVSVRNLAVPLAVFAVCVFVIFLESVNRTRKQTVAVLIIVVTFLHIFYFSQKYFSFNDRSRIFPSNEILTFIRENQGYSRSWGIGDAFLENNFATQYGIFWPEGYDSLNNRSYSEFTYAMQGAMLADFVFRADAGLGRGDVAELIENPARRRLVDLVGVKYVIVASDQESVLGQYGFKKVTSWGEYAVWENLQVMPRVFLASNYEGPPTLSNVEELSDEQIRKERRRLIFDKLLDDNFDFRSVIILEKPSPISAQFGEGSAEIVSYKPQEVEVRTKSDQPKLLFLSDNYYPGWKASVDGDETQILRANYTFRAVPLIPGAHEVRFYYDSDVFRVGAIISIVSLMALLALVFNGRKLISL